MPSRFDEFQKDAFEMLTIINADLEVLGSIKLSFEHRSSLRKFDGESGPFFIAFGLILAMFSN